MSKPNDFTSDWTKVIRIKTGTAVCSINRQRNIEIIEKIVHLEGRNIYIYIYIYI